MTKREQRMRVHLIGGAPGYTLCGLDGFTAGREFERKNGGKDG